MLNLDRELLVPKAPISGQCARAYFYGDDGELERHFGQIESLYGQVVRKIENHSALTPDDFVTLRIFALLQYKRTQVALQHTQAALSGMLDRFYVGEREGDRPADEDERTLVMLALSTALKARHQFDDLKAYILDNRTRIDFITSDNPAVIVNRWCWQRQKHHRFGLASSGLILSLPLSPRLLLCYFDAGTYSCPGPRSIFRPITDERDVESLNELQVLNAQSNVYFSNWEAKETIFAHAMAAKQRRPAERVNFAVLVEDDSGQDGYAEGQRYRRATEEEMGQPLPKLVTQHRIHPVPQRWISALRIRPKVRAYSNGSAAGFVRDPNWLTG